MTRPLQPSKTVDLFNGAPRHSRRPKRQNLANGITPPTVVPPTPFKHTSNLFNAPEPLQRQICKLADSTTPPTVALPAPFERIPDLFNAPSVILFGCDFVGCDFVDFVYLFCLVQRKQSLGVVVEENSCL
ncbi:hypothetical protein ACOSP7_002446 [Xanthoceras sorbifolium]